MTMPSEKMCYFLCYRRRGRSKNIDWDHPTGGMVVEPLKVIGNIAVSDFRSAIEAMEDRFHCGPGEDLVIMEVFEQEYQSLAWLLHIKWQRDMHQFFELMEVTG